MSGRVESLTTVEIGWPSFISSKWSPTRRETKIWWTPTRCPRSRSPTAPWCRRASGSAATRGSSASWPGARFSAHLSSAPCEDEQPPVASSTLVCPAVPLPTACQWKPPAPALVSATALDAKTCLLVRRPVVPVPSSYHTTHGTVSPAPVKAKSGLTPSRLGSMFSDGSPLALKSSDEASTRLRPTCCQQKLETLWLALGVKPVQSLCLTARETKIWFLAAAPSVFPRHPRHRVGAGLGGPAHERRVLGVLVGVDVQRGDEVLRRAVLALGDPGVVGGVEAAGEDLRLGARDVAVGLVPRRPRHGAPGAGEVDRRRLGLLVGLDVQRLALRLPRAVLERADEDVLRRADLLLEGAPGHRGLGASSAPPTTSETPASWLGSMPTAGSSLPGHWVAVERLAPRRRPRARARRRGQPARGADAKRGDA